MSEIQSIEDFRVRREIVHTNGPAKFMAVAMEKARRLLSGPPEEAVGDEEVEAAIERWLDPEPVHRSLVRQALWEVEQCHYWDIESLTRCRCGAVLAAPELRRGGWERFDLMRCHKEDRLAAMLGLTIMPNPGSDEEGEAG